MQSQRASSASNDAAAVIEELAAPASIPAQLVPAFRVLESFIARRLPDAASG
jgi:hypothetical protein